MPEPTVLTTALQGRASAEYEQVLNQVLMVKVSPARRKVLLASLGMWHLKPVPSVPWPAKWRLQPGQLEGRALVSDPLGEMGRLQCVIVTDSDPGRPASSPGLRQEIGALGRVEQPESRAEKPSRGVDFEWQGSVCKQGSPLDRKRCPAWWAGPGGQSSSEAPHWEGSVTEGNDFMGWPWQPDPGPCQPHLRVPRSQRWALLSRHRPCSVTFSWKSPGLSQSALPVPGTNWKLRPPFCGPYQGPQQQMDGLFDPFHSLIFLW